MKQIDGGEEKSRSVGMNDTAKERKGGNNCCYILPLFYIYEVISEECSSTRTLLVQVIKYEEDFYRFLLNNVVNMICTRIVLVKC